MTTKTFPVIADNGHAWLIVGPADMQAAGLTEADISRYSYARSDHKRIALEEDCDLGTFVQAYEAATGKDVRFSSTHVERSRVRNWPSFGTKKFDW